MALKLPVPGLRPVHYNARSAAKVQLTVQPGDTLIVSDDVAAQLAQGSAQFKVDELPPDESEPEAVEAPVTEPESVDVPPAVEPEPVPVKKPRAKKSTARKS